MSFDIKDAMRNLGLCQTRGGAPRRIVYNGRHLLVALSDAGSEFVHHISGDPLSGSSGDQALVNIFEDSFYVMKYQSGDTIYAAALKNKMDLKRWARLNNIKPLSLIKVSLADGQFDE